MNLGQAIALTAQGFKDKTDRSGVPYIMHCIEVMGRMDTDDEKILAILHDTVEDGVCTISQLRVDGLAEDIIQDLILLTHIKEQMSYDDYIKRLSQSQRATKVKLSDLRHNSDITRLKGLTKKDFDRLEKYNRSYVYLSKL